MYIEDLIIDDILGLLNVPFLPVLLNISFYNKIDIFMF